MDPNDICMAESATNIQSRSLYSTELSTIGRGVVEVLRDPGLFHQLYHQLFLYHQALCLYALVTVHPAE